MVGRCISFPFGMAYFQGFAVSFREYNPSQNSTDLNGSIQILFGHETGDSARDNATKHAKVAVFWVFFDISWESKGTPPPMPPPNK